MKKYWGYILLMFLIIIIFFICYKPKKEYTKTFFYMDTVINVKIYSNNKKKAIKTLSEVEHIYSSFHQLSDRYNSDGELYKINNNTESTDWLTIDHKLYELIKYGLTWYENSNHLLDINLGSVIDVWKKYREQQTGIPTSEELINAKNSNKIELGNDNMIKSNHPSIDLGALSKGYTTEKAGQYLESIGVNSYLINAGGNVKVGKHYKNKNYKIGIQSPVDSGLLTTVNIHNKSVVTSGGYERYYEYNGIKYHHIIDPVTLFPSNKMKSVTVITEDSGLADALSTTLFLMDIEEGKQYIKKFDDVEVVWCSNNNEIIKSEGFSQYE